jgi:hypothetical protein
MKQYKHSDAECKQKLEGVIVLLQMVASNSDISESTALDNAIEMVTQLVRELDT